MELEKLHDIDVDDKSNQGLDHRDMVHLQLFGSSKQIMSTEPMKKTVEFIVKGNDGNAKRGVGTITFGEGQPQEPQFQLFSDFLSLWAQESEEKYGDDLDLDNSQHRTITFESIQSLLKLQGRTGMGSIQMGNLVRDIKVLHHTSFSMNLKQENPLEYSTKKEITTNKHLSMMNEAEGHHLIDNFKLDDNRQQYQSYKGSIVLGRYFCESAKKGYLVTYSKSIYRNKKLGHGTGQRLYRMLNMLDYDEKREEIRSHKAGFNYIAKTVFEYNLDEWLFDVMGYRMSNPEKGPSATERKRFKLELKKVIGIFIALGLLEDEPGGAKSCFYSKSNDNKKATYVRFKLGSFFQESDRRKAEEELITTNYDERDVMERLNSLNVSGTQPRIFIEQIHKNKSEDVIFLNDKFEKVFKPNQFNLSRLGEIINWFELREQFKKSVNDWPIHMKKHEGAGILVNCIKFDSYNWIRESEYMTAYFEEKLSKDNFTPIYYPHEESEESKQESEKTNKLLRQYRIEEEKVDKYRQVLRKKLSLTERSSRTWVKDDSFFHIKGKYYWCPLSKLAYDHIKKNPNFSKLKMLEPDLSYISVEELKDLA